MSTASFSMKLRDISSSEHTLAAVNRTGPATCRRIGQCSRTSGPIGVVQATDDYPQNDDLVTLAQVMAKPQSDRDRIRRAEPAFRSGATGSGGRASAACLPFSRRNGRRCGGAPLDDGGAHHLPRGHRGRSRHRLRVGEGESGTAAELQRSADSPRSLRSWGRAARTWICRTPSSRGT